MSTITYRNPTDNASEARVKFEELFDWDATLSNNDEPGRVSYLLENEVVGEWDEEEAAGYIA